jgi:HAD superfamily hydrolase (TIGR01459 family)
MTIPPILAGVASLAATCDVWLCDIWGVVHDGLRAHAEAVLALEYFREAGGTVILITNAPRPAADVMAQLDGMGVPRRAYDRIVTSGDLTRQWVSEAKVPLYHLGPAKDLGVFAGLDARMTEVDAANLIVCTGLFDDDTETPEDYRARLTGYAARRLPMICANPDITVERGERLLYCSGAIAALYETLGGRVRYAGKPHPEVYETSLRAAAEIRDRPIDRSRVLGIGDSLRTDMAGAHAAGIRALFIASAIHVDGPLTDDALAELFAEAASRPVAAMAGLKW